MNLYNDDIFFEDIETEAKDANIPWVGLMKKNVLITGATGLFGSHLTHVLSKRGAKVFAVGRNTEKLSKLPAVPVAVNDIADPLAIDDEIDFIIHGANPTQSKEFVEKPVDVVKSILGGTANILDFAVKKNVQGFVYLSTMEVYGESDKYPITESDLGYLDLCNPRNGYPEAKRMAENLCACYFTQYALPVKIARPAQTFGSGAEYNDTRLFAHLARAAVEKKDIVLHTRGGTIRNYVYISDAVRAILYILLKGKNNQAYNVADKNSECSISEMAELVAKEYGVKVVYDIKDDGGMYPAEHRTVIDPTRLENLGWSAEVPLPRRWGVNTIIAMFDRLIGWFEAFNSPQ
jgi:nucleoside-diphosphate-sugar epimerase